MTVIEFPKKPDPHRQGEARCLNCKHKWQAVAPIGVTGLECPNCGTGQGLFDGLSCTQFPQWSCACGEMVFFIDVNGPYCAHCGIRPKI
jgi:hypothetical protein